jgi:hypothetical protein
MVSLPPGVGPLSPDQVRTLVAQSSGLDGAEGPGARLQVLADYVRQALSTFGSAAAGPPSVHVLRLLNSVRRQLGFWLEDGKEPDPARAALDALVDLREAADAGFGFYLPTPMRRVDLQGGGALLIGSLPTRLLERRLGLHGAIRTAGLARVLKPSDSGRLPSGALPAQPFRNWLGTGESDLSAWTDQRLREARRALKLAAGDVGPFEVYLPEADPRSPQYFRWVSTEKWSRLAARSGHTPLQLYLCRLRNKQADRYWLGRLRASDDGTGVQVVREAPIHPVETRRLSYGLDLRSGCPVRARLEHAPGGGSELVLNSWLPPEEWRLLKALTVRVSADKEWPLRFRLESVWVAAIDYALRGLGVRVEAE